VLGALLDDECSFVSGLEVGELGRPSPSLALFGRSASEENNVDGFVRKTLSSSIAWKVGWFYRPRNSWCVLGAMLDDAESAWVAEESAVNDWLVLVWRMMIVRAGGRWSVRSIDMSHFPT
jgi:hypothetical protein